MEVQSIKDYSPSFSKATLIGGGVDAFTFSSFESEKYGIIAFLVKGSLLYCDVSTQTVNPKQLEEAKADSESFRSASDIVSAIKAIIDIYKRPPNDVSELSTYLKDQISLKNFEFRPLNGEDGTIRTLPLVGGSISIQYINGEVRICAVK